MVELGLGIWDPTRVEKFAIACGRLGRGHETKQRRGTVMKAPGNCYCREGHLLAPANLVLCSVAETSMGQFVDLGLSSNQVQSLSGATVQCVKGPVIVALENVCAG